MAGKAPPVGDHLMRQSRRCSGYRGSGLLGNHRSAAGERPNADVVNFSWNSLLHYIYLACVGVDSHAHTLMCTMVHVWTSEDNLWESCLNFHHVKQSPGHCASDKHPTHRATLLADAGIQFPTFHQAPFPSSISTAFPSRPAFLPYCRRPSWGRGFPGGSS